jgi:4-amino-4-deoxy-L-arabinose transferase-like glycosyltransferase
VRKAAWDTDRLIWAAIGLLLILRIALSDHMIQDPGIQMDEGLFVNAATLRLPGIWITHSFDGIPLMVFPYIGALKSWLYDPVFAILGNSPTTIRMPVVFITSAGLVLLYPAVRDLVNGPVALLVFVVLCFDNSLFWLTRDDVGPSAITFFLECAAIFCAARWMRAPRARWIGLLDVVLALGVFNKLNFIWIVNAAVVISAVVIARHRRALRRHLRELVVWCAGLAALYACFAAYYITNRASFGPGGVGLGAISHTWPQFQLGTRAILSGTWFVLS